MIIYNMNDTSRIDDEDYPNTDISDYNYENNEEYTDLMDKINKLCEKQLNHDNDISEKNNLELNNLSKLNISTALNEKTKINICAYQINKSGLYPFLQFFMRKFKMNENNPDVVSFIQFECTKEMNIISKCNDILNVILLSYMKIGHYDYKGFKIFNNEVFMYYDLSECQIGTHRLNRNDDLWLVLVDEIVNYNSICNFQIDSHVVNYFQKNNDSFFLKNKNGNYIETPIVAYNYALENQIKFISVFGTIRLHDENAVMGPYYYFTNYEKAVEKNKDVKENGGIVRFALFTGNMKVPLNLPQDKPDESEKTLALLMSDSSTITPEYKKIRNMLRISDRDASWVHNYDSIYIGNMYFDDGTVNEDSPYWVVKTYEQQIPLTYHMLNGENIR